MGQNGHSTRFITNTVALLRGMIKRFLVGGITLFTWGFVSWVVLTWHLDTVRHDSGVTVVVEDIEGHLQETGVYYFPPMPTMVPDDDFLHRGPP